MSANEQALVKFVLECAAAVEPGSVVEAFREFLSRRLEPKAMSFVEASEEARRSAGRGVLLKAGSNPSFLMNLSPPQVVEVLGASETALSDFELEAIDKALAAFREKYQTIIDLRGLTYTDDVTGLYNQRYLEAVLERELALSKRNGTSFSVLFLDLDHFKKINDTYGHLVGSRILCEAGDEIKETLRESDLTFRFGGDEFVCVLSHTNLVEAMIVAERVRLRLEQKQFLAVEGLDIRITASIGVASYPEHALTRDEILGAADEALYGSKDGPRNRVVQASILRR